MTAHESGGERVLDLPEVEALEVQVLVANVTNPFWTNHPTLVQNRYEGNQVLVENHRI